MGPNAKAGLGFGLAQGFQTMGMMLLDAQDRAEQRAFREYQIKMDAKDRARVEKDREYGRWFQKEEFRRAGEAAERAERVKEQDAIMRATAEAQDEQRRAVAQGFTGARLAPRTGVDGWMSQVPMVEYGDAPPKAPTYFNLSPGQTQYERGPDGSVRPLVTAPKPDTVPTGPGAGGMGDPRKLPVGVQQALAAYGGTLDSLGRYEELAIPYMGRGRFDRAAGRLGIPDKERDQIIGQLESAQRSVLVNAKELANLGVLNGPDMELLTGMIGDPLSTASVIRDPSYTIGKLREARNFIEGRKRAYERLYGGGESPGLPDNPGDPTEDWRLRFERESGR